MTSRVKSTIAIIIAILVVAVVAVIVIVGNSSAKEEPQAVATPSPTIATQSPSASAVAPVVVPTTPPSATPPTVTSVALDGLPPEVSPDVEFTVIEGDPSADSRDATATPEEIKMRNDVYNVIPTFLNSAGPQYADAKAAPAALMSKGLITANMAENGFTPEFTPSQMFIRNAKFTVQTTAMRCYLRGQSPDTAFDLGRITCHYMREYLTEDGGSVNKQKMIASDVLAIDPEQQALLVINIKQEDGVWKVDSIKTN